MTLLYFQIFSPGYWVYLHCIYLCNLLIELSTCFAAASGLKVQGIRGGGGMTSTTAVATNHDNFGLAFASGRCSPVCMFNSFLQFLAPWNCYPDEYYHIKCIPWATYAVSLVAICISTAWKVSNYLRHTNNRNGLATDERFSLSAVPRTRWHGGPVNMWNERTGLRSIREDCKLHFNPLEGKTR